MKKLLSVPLLVLFLILTGCGGGTGTDSGGMVIQNESSGGSISLSWDANGESDLAGYKVYYGTAPGVYSHSTDVGKVTTYSLTGLTKGNTYFIAATAYDTSHNESDYSNEVSGMAR